MSAALLFTVVWAMICNATLDLVQAGGSWSRIVSYELDETLGIFVLSSAVLWLLLLGLVALTGRIFLGAALLLGVTLALAYANYEKLRLRAEPVYPSDLAFAGQAGFLRDMVGLGPLLAVGVVALLGTGTLLLTGRVVAPHLPPIRRRMEPRAWRVWVVGRVAVLLAVGLGTAYLATFNAPGNVVKQSYVDAGAQWAFWSQRVNYLRHGVVAGLLYNLDVPAMQEPAGYSRETMTGLAERYGRVADRTNRGRDARLLEELNVVVVLSEAFSDPTIVPGVTLDEDPIPFTRRLMASTTSGSMLTQQVGGGTANMEFEAMTGLSLAQFQPQLNSPYPMLVAGTKAFPSAVRYFEALGKHSIAVHPYSPLMYKRDRVYPALGFDEFVHEKTMRFHDRVDRNDFISDASAFEEVRARLEKSDEPLFVNLVTMQNHYPNSRKYDDPVGVTGVSGDAAEQLGGYARGLSLSDAALRDFVRSLERSDEPTAVVVYGDHTPAFWPETSAFADHEELLRRTPFLLWSNVADLPAEELPVTSPEFFLPLLLDRLGVPLPPFYALLLQVHAEVPAMAQGEYHSAGGTVSGVDELGVRAQKLLADYRLAQYDLVAGNGYAEEELFSPGSAPEQRGQSR